jgi:hypothetical protein
MRNRRRGRLLRLAARCRTAERWRAIWRLAAYEDEWSACWLYTRALINREARVSRTVLGAPGGGIPPGDSTAQAVCHITQTWRGKPLSSRQTVVELIASTTTKTGLTVRCELDTRTYQKGIKVSDAEMATLNIKGDAFHPEWNYTILPRVPP